MKVLEIIIPRREYKAIKEILEEARCLKRISASIEASSEVGLDTLRLQYAIHCDPLTVKEILEKLSVVLRGKLGYYLVYDTNSYASAYISKKYINIIPSVCIYCGSPMNPNDIVCKKCGKKYPFLCPNCGSKMTLAKQCPVCGLRL
ncbi:MAG: hypothetical protein DRJ52_00685 [Thermoprotei archaeon]|nr:MAG: hypothetical protein DRJ52_00685 [Thermoprotei archaeon]RLF00409.1 MAG: hypothetical protein DRJ63_02400 [Thermoprotei archaeon]